MLGTDEVQCCIVSEQSGSILAKIIVGGFHKELKKKLELLHLKHRTWKMGKKSWMYARKIVFMQTQYQTNICGLCVGTISIKTFMDTKYTSLHVSVTLHSPVHTCAHSHTLSSYMNTVVLTVFQLKSYLAVSPDYAQTKIHTGTNCAFHSAMQYFAILNHHLHYQNQYCDMLRCVCRGGKPE